MKRKIGTIKVGIIHIQYSCNDDGSGISIEDTPIYVSSRASNTQNSLEYAMNRLLSMGGKDKDLFDLVREQRNPNLEEYA